MTLLRLCMTDISAPTMPSLASAGKGGAASGISVTWSISGQKCIFLFLSLATTKAGNSKTSKLFK